jgi:hypothetical protein
MTRTGLIRLGGVAMMVGGILYALQMFWFRPLLMRMSDTESSWIFYILIVSFLALLVLGMMAIVALDGQSEGRYGLIAALASLTVGVGAAAILAGMGMSLDIFGSDLPLLFLIVGALVATVGLESGANQEEAPIIICLIGLSSTTVMSTLKKAGP